MPASWSMPCGRCWDRATRDPAVEMPARKIRPLSLLAARRRLFFLPGEDFPPGVNKMYMFA